ncbi:MAG: N-6 DNA methylase, partial [Nitrospinota bacterium]
IFYTPSDVADYMAKNVLSNYTGDITSAKCFDPACGSGVFLLSLCREIESFKQNREDFNRFKYVTTNLFGCDISAHAVEACTFVLLYHCLTDVRKLGLSPWSAWHAIRLNLANIDSLLLSPSHPDYGLHFDITLREKQKQMLLKTEPWVMPIKEQLQNSKEPSYIFSPNQRMIGINELFAEAKHGFHILVGNPPYSKIGERTDYDLLSREYNSFTGGKARPQDSIFLPFIEMMWRLTVCGQNSSALVTPLSIAYNSGNKFIECRNAMQRRGGQWKFAFFDREPHALFGEEVKTRNAILFRNENINTPPRSYSSVIETGPLRKWTSRTRKQLFESIQFTAMGQFDMVNGIPKIEGHLQSSALGILKSSNYRFELFCSKINSCSLSFTLKREDSNFIYIGGTAYNFLNVFRKFSAGIKNEYPLSKNPVHSLEFMSEAEASAAFAILSSRLIFWLWHIQADGFHVTSWFVRSLPFQRETFSSKQLNRLSELGASLWSKVQAHCFSSINGGKLTYTFRPLSCNEERDEIDLILVKASNLPPEFALELKEFVRKIVVVDENDNKRKHLKNYFIGGIKLCVEN